MFFYTFRGICTKNRVVNFFLSVIKFIPDNEGLDQLISYRGVCTRVKRSIWIFLSPKNVTSWRIEELEIWEFFQVLIEAYRGSWEFLCPIKWIDLEKGTSWLWVLKPSLGWLLIDREGNAASDWCRGMLARGWGGMWDTRDVEHMTWDL